MLFLSLEILHSEKDEKAERKSTRILRTPTLLTMLKLKCSRCATAAPEEEEEEREKEKEKRSKEKERK